MKKYNNAEFNINDLNKNVTLYGWVQKKRNLGGLIFIDLRDRSGIIQIVVKPDNKDYATASSLKNESVIEASGTITKRENKNEKLKTGEIELSVSRLKLINQSADIPFEITDNTTALEETRLKYRYLDIRRNTIKNNLIMRSKIMMAAREFLDSEYFIEVETPILCKSTPEGARDYLVPSRVNKGKFYALPQSPQLFKQLLMVGGIEKYFQIAKCFRDEDLRADRQPEFTQIDMEMSFVDEQDVMDVTEKLIAYVFKKVKNIDIKLPLDKMKYDDAINLYGSDKPDLRFDMQIKDLTNIFKNTDFGVFKKVLEENGIINAILVKDCADKYSRKSLESLTEFVKTYKASGLAYLKFDKEVTGSIVKVVSTAELNDIKQKLNINDNDLLLIVSGKYNIVKTALGALRCKLARDLNLIDHTSYKLLWITDFPSFEWSEEEQRYVSQHHPFTAPKDEDVEKLITDKANCYSKAYDIVINGYETGGGSIRIHDQEIQSKMFKALELSDNDVKEKFGFFVDALKYGTPPHGGLALGLDRLTMLLSNTENIKDVIAFPKTTSASCLMSDCPNTVDEKQLEELKIKVVD